MRETGPGAFREVVAFNECAGISVGSVDVWTHGVLLSGGVEYNGHKDVPGVSLRAMVRKGEALRASRAEVVVASEAAGEIGLLLVRNFSAHATPEARRALLEKLAEACDPDAPALETEGMAPC